MLKFFKQSDWKQVAVMTAMIFPCYMLLTLSLGDIVESAMGTTAAVPFSEGLMFYLLWWAIDAPCATYGAYKGYLKPLSLEPEVGQIKRSIPEMPWHLRKPAIAALYGPLIFATIFFEFGYIMDSVWRSYMIYGMFAILFVTLVMMGITIAALSIMLTYELLSH